MKELNEKVRLEKLFAIAHNIAMLELQLVCPHRKYYNTVHESRCLDCDLNPRQETEKFQDYISKMKTRLAFECQADYDNIVKLLENIER